MAKVLLVEDHSDILYNLAEILEIFDFEVQACLSAKKALDVLRSWCPDVIVSDVLMPEMDGFEFLRVLKKSAELSHVPVIFLTAAAEREVRQRALESGVADFLVKPTSYEQLIAAIEACLVVNH